MSHPRPTLRRRLAAPAAALAGCLVLAGCRSSQIIEECPGLPMALLKLEAARETASCQGDTAPSDGDQACADANQPDVRCQLDRPVPACCFNKLFPPSLKFQATIAYDQATSAASFCLPVPNASPYPGTHAPAAGGDQVSFSLDTSGAVLASCSPTCAVTVLHEVSGLLLRNAESGAVTGFIGLSTETAAATPAATCAPCAAPCAATWTLTGAP